MIKRNISIIIIITLIISYNNLVFGKNEKIKLCIDWKPVSTTIYSIEYNGNIMVPLREVYEALGSEVTWDNKNKTIYVKNRNEMVLQVCKTAVTIKGKNKSSSLITTVNGKTMVPLSFISECFGYVTQWDNESKVIDIYTNNNSYLLEAIVENNTNEVKRLLEEGADPNYTDDTLKYSALNWAMPLPEKDEIIDLLIKYGAKVDVISIDTFQTYINNKYKGIETVMGKYTFSHVVTENDVSYNPYDYCIQTEWSGGQPYDIQYSIKYTQNDKEKTVEALKNIQENIAKDFFKFFPNKKVMGGYYRGYYEYPYLKVGYKSIRFLSWINYTYDLLNNHEYSKTSISNFQWFNLYDDYNFIGEPNRTR